MILEFGQTFAFGHLHADLVLLGRHTRAFTEKQKLGPRRPKADYWENQAITLLALLITWTAGFSRRSDTPKSSPGSRAGCEEP